MLGVGGLPLPLAPPLVGKRATSINPNYSNLIQDQSHKANYSLLSLGRIGFRLFAQKKHIGSNFGGLELVKKAGFEEEDGFEFDDDFDEDEDGDFDDEDEDDDLMVPFQKMDAWLKNKPRGFGEGKVYDTSIEDKLLEEIEQSREAQLANVNKLKNEQPKEPISKKDLKVSEGVPTGIRVRINNLPKKRNIHRDLKSAFEGISGIINISPVVSGNKKTREPVCKGFGFLDFKTLEDANRFVQTFSGQNVTFGKLQKHIKCEILKPSDAGHEDSVHNVAHITTSKSRSTLSEDKGDQDSDTEQTNPTLQLWEEEDDCDESDEELDEDFVDIPELLTSSGLKEKSTTDSASSTHEQKSKKKSTARKKPDKINPALQVWEDDDYDESDEELDDKDLVDIFELQTSSRLKKKSTADSASSMREQKTKPVKKKSTARKKPELNSPLQLWKDDEYDESDDEELDDEIIANISKLTLSGLKEKLATNSASSMRERMSKAVKKKSTARKKVEKINPPLPLWEDDHFHESDGDIIDISESLTSSGLKEQSTTDSASSKHERKTTTTVKKKSTARKSPDKISKLNIPGSAKRLKVQEKAKLADVFSRYGSKEALASKQM